MIHFAVYTLQYAQYLVSLSSLSVSLPLIHLVLPSLSRSKCCSVSAFQSLSLSLFSLKNLSLYHSLIWSCLLSLRLCLSFIRFCLSLSLLLCLSLTLSLSKILFINMINVSSYLVGTHFVFIYYCIKRYTYCTQECSLIPREIKLYSIKIVIDETWKNTKSI